VVVLFSGFGDNRGIDSETLRRLNHAHRLVKDSAQAKIICVGGARPRTNRFGSLLMRDYLSGLGYHPSRIITETGSNSSQSNIFAATQILEERKVPNATLVSSPIHLLRLKWMLGKMAPKMEYHFRPYHFRDADPSISWLTIYRQIHHEFAAFIAGAILSNRSYKRLIDFLRP
jgi:uncharacterized SAM-binding protein YcdF (DUF218 family)